MNPLGGESPKNAEERNVRFRDGFKQPIFLMEFLMFGVPNEWEVSVKEKGQ